LYPAFCDLQRELVGGANRGEGEEEGKELFITTLWEELKAAIAAVKEKNRYERTSRGLSREKGVKGGRTCRHTSA